MKKLLLFLLCIIISGCAIFQGIRGNERELLKKEIAELQETLAKKNIQIDNLQKLIAEKDATIKKLKDKLNTFGVFE